MTLSLCPRLLKNYMKSDYGGGVIHRFHTHCFNYPQLGAPITYPLFLSLKSSCIHSCKMQHKNQTSRGMIEDTARTTTGSFFLFQQSLFDCAFCLPDVARHSISPGLPSSGGQKAFLLCFGFFIAMCVSWVLVCSFIIICAVAVWSILL